MTTISAIAQSGYLRAIERFDASAQRTAQQAGSDSYDAPTEVVEQIQARTAASANLAVLRTADEMTRRLLDLKV